MTPERGWTIEAKTPGAPGGGFILEDPEGTVHEVRTLAEVASLIDPEFAQPNTYPPYDH